MRINIQSNPIDSYKQEIIDPKDIDAFKKYFESLIPDYIKKEQEIAVRTSEQSKIMMLGPTS